MRSRIITSLCMVGMLATLSGCVEPPRGDPDTNTDAVTTSECSNYMTHYQTCVITMPDSRRVTCIEGTNAIDCDWAHADGADKGWSE